MTTVTFDQVDQLAAELPPQDQLRLVSRISDRLTTILTPATQSVREEEDYFAKMDAFIKMCEDAPIEAIGEVDSAEDIRQIRAARMERL